MKIFLSTMGTRGDIQPFIALGQGLQRAGHQVTLCTAEGYRSFVEEHGIPYAYMDNEFLAIIQSQTGQAAMESKRGILAIYQKIGPIIRRALEDEWRAVQAFQPDVIVYHPKMLGSYHIAEKLQIPAWMSLALPFQTPTRAFPNPLFTGVTLGGWFNRLSYRLLDLGSIMYAGVTNDFRVKSLGLPPKGRFSRALIKTNGEPVPVLYAYSPHLVPRPVDFPPEVQITGFWFLEQGSDWQPTPALLAFLEAEPPPVYVGFGSMSGNSGAERGKLVVEALQQAGQRGILASGWGGLQTSKLPTSIFPIDAAPHEWLFPRVAAVVHHGGSGTTAAGLRAGKPTVICPFIADQPFWGQVVYSRGVGPQPIPQKKLTVANLAAAITAAVTDSAMQQRAAELGTQIRAEAGVAHAVARLEEASHQQPRL
ncbi:MAG: glycosyltransferase family 1 protein [Caldilineaceae bacterium]|nr:glycosyltransferase family 1 protein [Caldilineaceae bacterium]